MIWITRSRQRSVWLLLLIMLVLSLSLVACGQLVNASDTNAPNKSIMTQQQQFQTTQPARSSNSGTNANTNTNLQSTDQQVQSILGQLESAHNDVNNSNATSSQDNGQ